jgi:ribosomal protein L12E/L44/L45/RPP1/RPP2
MQTAWRERNPEARIKSAKEAIAINVECATAYILLAEEEAKDIAEADAKFREAYRIAEANHRRSQQLQHQNSMMENQHRRDTNVMIYIRRRLAMCARKLGRLKEVIIRLAIILTRPCVNALIILAGC